MIIDNNPTQRFIVNGEVFDYNYVSMIVDLLLLLNLVWANGHSRLFEETYE